MSDIWIPYGGGADLDPVTAAAADVRKGKVIVNKEGDPITGTMAERAAATYTPGRSNQTIAANQYLTGAQTIKGDANLLAQYIKKGVTIFGITGSWEGYVPAATDLYYKGANPFGMTGSGSTYFETTYIFCILGSTSVVLNLDKTFNFSNYSKFVFEFTYTGAVTNNSIRVSLQGNTSGGIAINYRSEVEVTPGNNHTISISLKDKTACTVNRFVVSSTGMAGTINIRINRMRFA